MKKALLGRCTVASLLSFGLLIIGCTPEDHCDPLDQCGGSVLSNGAQDFYLNDGLVDTEWWAYGGDECQDPLHTPPLQNTLVNQPAHLANEPPPERSSMDWCSNLKILPDRTIDQVNLWFPQIPMQQAKLTYSAVNADATEGTFQVQFEYFERMRADFSAQCMTAQGVVMGCNEFSAAMAQVLEAEPNVTDVRCVNGPQGGCACIYDMLLVIGVSGPWRRNGDLITHYDDIQAVPSEADYCVSGSDGNKLQLTGHDRTWVFNETGLRTLQFERATCSDNKRNQGELDVDCGGPCEACPPTCDDGIQNQDETGVDCGGSCPTPCP